MAGLDAAADTMIVSSCDQWKARVWKSFRTRFKIDIRLDPWMSDFPKPFEWTQTKAGKLMIYRSGELVMIMSPEKAAPILAKLGRDPEADQQVLARATGQYRMGNERMGETRRK